MKNHPQILISLLLTMILTCSACKKCHTDIILYATAALYPSSKNYAQIDSSKTYIFKNINSGAEQALELDKNQYIDTIVLFFCPIRCICQPNNHLTLAVETIDYNYYSIDSAFVIALGRKMPKKKVLVSFHLMVEPEGNKQDTFDILSDYLKVYVDSTYYSNWNLLSTRTNSSPPHNYPPTLKDTIIGGKQFYNVLNPDFTDNIYYSTTQGIIFFKDKNDQQWRLDRIE